MLFGGRAVHVNYFKHIRQGALKSDCVMLTGGARASILLVELLYL